MHSGWTRTARSCGWLAPVPPMVKTRSATALPFCVAKSVWNCIGPTSKRPLIPKFELGTAAVIVFGAATAVFGLSQSMLLSLAMLALLGAADMFSVYIRQSLIQLHTPDDMRGRVLSMYTFSFYAFNPFGNLAGGAFAELNRQPDVANFADPQLRVLPAPIST